MDKSSKQNPVSLELIIALLSGAMLPLAFAPFFYHPVAELSLFILLNLWSKKTPVLSARLGLCFGIGFFGSGIYWLYISIHYYGGSSVVTALLILLLLIIGLATYYAIVGYLLNRFFPCPNYYRLLLAFPTIWTISEWLRGYCFSGFPWLFLGYSHLNTPLEGFAPVFGVYGVSFVVAQTAGAIVISYQQLKKRKFPLITMLLISLLWTVGYTLNQINWTKKKPNQQPITACIVQGNISQAQKWQSSELDKIVNHYIELTKEALKDTKYNLIVWPEAAIPVINQKVKEQLLKLDLELQSKQAILITGTSLYNQQTTSYFNSLIALGAASSTYHKKQLVPFGEYWPFKPLLSWLENFIYIPMSDFEAGNADQSVLRLNKLTIAPFICYEIAYPDLLINYLPEANFIVTISDDSWFGKTTAAAQHLQIAQMRSLETGRYQLFATNTGITAIINHRGKIIAQAAPFEIAIINSSIEAYEKLTPWVKLNKFWKSYKSQLPLNRHP